MKLIKTNIFSDIQYLNLYPKGTKPARLYGTPKIHKAFLPGSLPPFRPIVSSIGTYNYNLAQYLGSLLSPHIDRSDNCRNDCVIFYSRHYGRIEM